MQQEEIKTDRRYKNTKDHKTFETHLRFSEEEYTELKSRAVLNNMKLNEYIKNVIFLDKYCILNTDYDLYERLGQILNVLTRTGNFLVKVGKLCEEQKDYKNLSLLREALEAERKGIKEFHQSFVKLQKSVLEKLWV